MPIATLDRTLLRLSGETVRSWLAGLITNNLDTPLSFAALLTPQGKIIADFFIHQDLDIWGDDLILETAPKFAPALLKRLKMYKLREKIDIIEVSAHSVYVLWDGEGDLGAVDPRAETLGRRFVSDQIIETSATADDYDLHRLSLSIPDSQYDFGSQERFPADVNMDLLSGVDFKKGCFIGQEVVSRMYRKTEVRKRMRSVRGTAPLTQSSITIDGRTVGDILYANENLGMALIRLDRIEGTKKPPQLESGLEVEILDPDF